MTDDTVAGAPSAAPADSNATSSASAVPSAPVDPAPAIPSAPVDPPPAPELPASSAAAPAGTASGSSAVSDAAAAPLTSAPAAPAADVLVVDDTPYTADMIRALLASNHDLTSQVAGLPAMQARLTELAAERDQAAKDVPDLQAKLKAAEDTVAAHEKEIDELKTWRDAAIAEFRGIREPIVALLGLPAENRDEPSKLVGQLLTHLGNEKASAKQAVDALNSEINARDKMIENLRAHVNNLMADPANAAIVAAAQKVIDPNASAEITVTEHSSPNVTGTVNGKAFSVPVGKRVTVAGHVLEALKNAAVKLVHHTE